MPGNRCANWRNKPYEEMTDKQLLRVLTEKIIAYDRKLDNYIGFLQQALTKAGVDYESLKGFERKLMERDDLFCQVREILRVVKKDPHLLWC